MFFKKKSIGNSRGRHDLKLLEFFELKLATVLFRANFFHNIVEANEAIRSGFVLVNDKITLCPYYVVNSWDIISFLPCFKKRLIKYLIHRLKFYRLFLGAPLYLEVNYKIGAIVFLRQFFIPKYIRNSFDIRMGVMQGISS